jgi:hypothetical protein
MIYYSFSKKFTISISYQRFYTMKIELLDYNFGIQLDKKDLEVLFHLIYLNLIH